jgi:hypothetical protein
MSLKSPTYDQVLKRLCRYINKRYPAYTSGFSYRDTLLNGWARYLKSHPGYVPDTLQIRELGRSIANYYWADNQMFPDSRISQRLADDNMAFQIGRAVLRIHFPTRLDKR